jgi:hypothetical protein
VEFDRQHRIGVEECVHAGGIRLQVRERLLVEARHDALRHARHAERSHEAVRVVRALAEEFRDAPVHHAALEFHLPKAVLRVHVAHREPASASFFAMMCGMPSASRRISTSAPSPLAPHRRRSSAAIREGRAMPPSPR